MADTLDFEYVLIDSAISKVHAMRPAQKRLKLPRSVVRVVA